MGIPRKTALMASRNLAILLPLFIFLACEYPQTNNGIQDNGLTASERMLWEFERLKDPRTNSIPEGIMRKELLFAKKLPTDAFSRNSYQQWEAIGPYNVGGRTRAGGVDVRNENIILAGGVSGGMWKSIDGGETWYKTTLPEAHHATSCLVQDSRIGRENIWYFGSGEGVGNSASKSFSALYVGNGIYKSNDNGETWQSITSTVSGTPQSEDDWDYVWRIALDLSKDNEDIIYAAIRNNIQKSNDGGASWTNAINSVGSNFTDVVCDSKGVTYATLSFDGSGRGVYRSEDGLNWTRIDAGFPNTTRRIVPCIDPNNENILYFLASTPGHGKRNPQFSGGTDDNSLFKYEYIAGDGSGNGGIWTNLSDNLPDSYGILGNFSSQGSYNITLAVQPGNSQNLIIGGTNLYLSTDAFTTKNNIRFIGGYEPYTELPFFGIYPNHHPDQHALAFLPNKNNEVLCFNDGGIYLCKNILADTVVWEDLNNGYITTQFYTVAVDKGSEKSFRIIGGTQDNGTYLTQSSNLLTPWEMVETGDGSYCAIANNGNTYFTSRQFGRMGKLKINNNNQVTQITRIDPQGGGDYRFINPYVLDPIDNNIMYLSEGNRFWRNDQLDQIPFDSTWQPISFGWQRYSSTVQGQITAMAVSQQPAHRLYLGTNARKIYRIDNAHLGDSIPKEITNNIFSGAYTSDIAVDPRDANKLIVVFSNYNVYSLFYSDNGGDSWQKIGGNLEPPLPSGFPPNLHGVGDGPSLRTAAIIPQDDGGTIYLVGGSTGLYGTDTLMGDSTTWVQQGAQSIGNVVVDKIDFRPSDKFTAIATHGNGIYYAYVNSSSAITEAKNLNDKSKFKIFPVPAHNFLSLNYPNYEGELDIRVFTLQGQVVLNDVLTSSSSNLNISHLNAGIYILQCSNQKEKIVTKFIKR